MLSPCGSGQREAQAVIVYALRPLIVDSRPLDDEAAARIPHPPRIPETETIEHHADSLRAAISISVSALLYPLHLQELWLGLPIQVGLDARPLLLSCLFHLTAQTTRGERQMGRQTAASAETVSAPQRAGQLQVSLTVNSNTAMHP